MALVLLSGIAGYFKGKKEKDKDEKKSDVGNQTILYGIAIGVVAAGAIGLFLWYRYTRSNARENVDPRPDDEVVEEEIEPTNTPSFHPLPPCERSSQHKTQESIRQMCERIFHVPFFDYKHPEIVNPETGRMLDLDIYNSNLQLAIEYNGEQHYKINSMSPTQDVLDKQKRRDAYKAQRCQELGIHLIVIPYTEKDRAFEMIMEALPPRLHVYRRQRLH